MTGWLVVVDREADLPPGLSGLPHMTTRDYLKIGAVRRRGHLRILNLSRSYAYQSLGYFASLLAEARGHKIVPTVSTILDLGRRQAYAYALPELEELLNRTLRRLSEPPAGGFRLRVYLGEPDDPRFIRFGRDLFDWFRAPMLEVRVAPGEWRRIQRVGVLAIDELDEDGRVLLARAIDRHVHSRWRVPRGKMVPRHTLAVLFDPKDPLPPSDGASIRHFARLAAPHGLGVETIAKNDLARLPTFDALWIRETTNIDHHSFRFARRAEQEGMPVIDDTTSIVRCTNKVYLAELMRAHGVPTPTTLVVSSVRELDAVERALPYPIVLKIPDGSFSRGVSRVQNRAELDRAVRAMLDDSALILAQEFMYTTFDWRIGILDGQPLFATQYLMARKHWQIVHHVANGRALQGRFKTFPIEAVPADVLRRAVDAAKPIGNGLYGVDLKANDRGVFVIEVNDNPNLDHTVEDAAEGDAVWQKLIRWFTSRLA